jgi:segregation and condensation protein B
MMTEAATAKASRNKANAHEDVLLDRELEDLPPDLRWREWMLRVEAVIFASAEPVTS